MKKTLPIVISMLVFLGCNSTKRQMNDITIRNVELYSMIERLLKKEAKKAQIEIDPGSIKVIPATNGFLAEAFIVSDAPLTREGLKKGVPLLFRLVINDPGSNQKLVASLITTAVYKVTLRLLDDDISAVAEYQESRGVAVIPGEEAYVIWKDSDRQKISPEILPNNLTQTTCSHSEKIKVCTHTTEGKRTLEVVIL
ncbi:hypothetical protein QQ008_20360 [Fulvivirgaceae bacterium BMA10]|uniref:Uncharacterized protein n=1 Tax=Splendidivirga corallicola TaxID=3051826 RepID=A0ABT8KSM1_9BACT|nr:hypothetical protein [Fulvivirgaceae bacterium BMA10]